MIASAAGLPPVSLVVPTRDRPDMVAAVVASVLAGDVVPDELLVADQSEPMTPLPAVETHGCVVRHLHCRPGLSRATNEAIRLATHDLLVVTHDDVLVRPDWLATLASAAARAGEGTVVTGRVTATAPERDGAFAPALWDRPERASWHGRVPHGVIRPMNVAFHRRDIEALGGYDERLGPGREFPGGEDADLGFRVLAAGLRVDYEPDAVVLHRAWRGDDEYLRLRWRYGLGHGAFYAAHLRDDTREIVHRATIDVARRVRAFPTRLRREGRRAWGDPLFVLASFVGAWRWWRRYGAVSSGPAALARPAIAPVATGLPRPTWSVMVPTYHCARSLGDTLRSVLAQGFAAADMQIEVVDDHSVDDDPAAVVAEVNAGRPSGAPEVGFHRRSANGGNIATFNTCLARSRGRYVHLLHGDDLVRPGFHHRLGAALDEHPDCVAAISGYSLIDDAGEEFWWPPAQTESPGVIDGWLERLATGQRIQPPSIAVRREVYEAVGGFDRRIHRYGEDWEMWTRIAAQGPVWCDPAPLACYRVHGTSISASSVRSGENLRDLRRAAAVNREVLAAHLPLGDVERLTAEAHRNHALAALRRGLRAFDDGDVRAARAQLTGALRTSRSPEVLLRTAELVPRLGVRVARRTLAGARAMGRP